MTTAALAGTERRHEAVLLAWALVIVVFAYTLLGLSQSPVIPAGTWVYGGSLAALALLAHLAVRRIAPHADPLLLPIVFLLNGLGLVFVRRVDFATGDDLAVLQTRWTVVGVGVFVAMLFVLASGRRLTRYYYTFGLLTILLLALPLLPVVGREVNGARLWVQVGALSFQPGEIAKLTLVLFLAGYLDQKRTLLSVATERVGPFLLPPFRHLAPVLAGAGAALLILVFQRDLGSSLLLLGVFIVLLYIATGRLAYPIIGGVSFATGGYVAYWALSHVRTRFDIWIDPWSQIDGFGRQIAQAQFALGTGGLTGTGLGLGLPTEIPFVATDFIFAVIGEELGLLGATAILLLFLLVIVRGYKIALTAANEVDTLVAAGLTTILALQVFIIVGGVTRVVPLTGITLPFISYGGSSLLGNHALIAFLVWISHQARKDVVSARAGAARGGGR
ncbi:MAG: FtsW/RodA/SpoVE family cell cycle protein [Nitriliruptorales bacterium]|nr:FtsW/RodA/SpoVE family cell cycle protein [Nitriliruptorales bacterium]